MITGMCNCMLLECFSKYLIQFYFTMLQRSPATVIIVHLYSMQRELETTSYNQDCAAPGKEIFVGGREVAGSETTESPWQYDVDDELNTWFSGYTVCIVHIRSIVPIFLFSPPLIVEHFLTLGVKCRTKQS